jgi:hypothetical protein
VLCPPFRPLPREPRASRSDQGKCGIDASLEQGICLRGHVGRLGARLDRRGRTGNRGAEGKRGGGARRGREKGEAGRACGFREKQGRVFFRMGHRDARPRVVSSLGFCEGEGGRGGQRFKAAAGAASRTMPTRRRRRRRHAQKRRPAPRSLRRAKDMGLNRVGRQAGRRRRGSEGRRVGAPDWGDSVCGGGGARARGGLVIACAPVAAVALFPPPAQPSLACLRTATPKKRRRALRPAPNIQRSL